MKTSNADEPRSPTELVEELTRLLDIETIDTDLYRGGQQPGGEGRVFGGQVVAQALQAAQRSIETDKVAHSLHAYFMRPGDENFPIIYRVVRDFDGGTFANRRVIAMQKGKPILNMTASFQRPEDGLHHQEAMPEVPGPEGLVSEADLRRGYAERVPEKFRRVLLRDRPIDIRPVEPRAWLGDEIEKRDPVQHCWFRLVGPTGDDPAMHRAILAYASDMTLLGTSLLTHGLHWAKDKLQSASLDHALWLHEDFRADEWLLYSCDSPWTGHARGFNRGQIFTRDGRLVASVSQEGLIRQRG